MTDKKEIRNYKYIKTIGEGTFGKVKLANHVLTGEKVAIKILQKKLIKNKNEYNRIEREIKYLKLFNHPNIIQIYEVSESSSSFYIVMEYAPGGELFNYIVEKEKLTEKESSFYFYQIIQAVKEIHKKKICHRDIKPENLLFTKNKILKIIDFGLSSEYDEFLSTPCGSPCYASPEMIKGEKYNGLSIDLWACGVILFAMLCGYLPFDDKNNAELFRRILECKIDYPEEDDVELSEISLDLINKILTPNPKKRISIENILEHPFMDYGKKIYNTVIKPDNFTQEELIIDYMKNELGFNNKNNIIEKYIHSNRHNNITTTYYLLKQKYIDGRLNYSFKAKLMKKIGKADCTKNIINNSNNKNNNSSSFNNNSNSNINFSKNKISYIKKKFQNDENLKKHNNKIYNISDYNLKKRSKTSSSWQSKKNIFSLKDMLKHKCVIDRNNIIIINNTNMIQPSERIKPIYNNLIFKQENSKNNTYRKIETSISLEKSLNKNNNLANNLIANFNSDVNKLNNTYRNNKSNLKGGIKVSLKKEEKNEGPFGYFRKFKENELLDKKKYIYLPTHNFLIKSNTRKSQKNKYNLQNDFLVYQKNSTRMGGFTNHLKSIYSFDVNASNNFNSSITNNYINALSYDMTNFNYNKKSDQGMAAISSSRNKKNNFKNIIITEEISNKYQYKNKLLNKNEPNFTSTIEINKENTEIISKRKSKNKVDKNKNKITYVNNNEKIFRKIYRQNNRNYLNYINNNKKASYNKKSKEKKRIQENYKNKFISMNGNNINRNKGLKNIKKEYLCPSTYRFHIVNKSINNLNINNVNSNKTTFKNLLTKNVNSNNIPKKTNQNKIQTTIENNFNKLKNLIKNNPSLFKKNCESFCEKNMKLSKKNNTFKNLSPNGNNKSKDLNINTFSNINKKRKINRNIKDILSLKDNMKKNNKINNKSNTGKISQSEKENIPIESSSRNYFNKSNYNYNNIPISSRDKPLYVSRNQNYEINNDVVKSNTEIIDQNKIFQNNFLSERKSKKNFESSKFLNINKKNMQNKKHNKAEKFLSANTEMSLLQIYEKFYQFCKENNLEYKKEGKNKYVIFDKNLINSFIVEIIDSSSKNSLNIVKFYHGKNIGTKMKEMSTKLFMEIYNF